MFLFYITLTKGNTKEEEYWTKKKKQNRPVSRYNKHLLVV